MRLYHFSFLSWLTILPCLSMSCRPCGTKLPCVACSSNESCMHIRLLNLNKTNLTRLANHYLPMTVTKKIYELTILSTISCATSDVIWPCRLVRAIFHFKCLATGDGGSKLSVGLSVHECSSCPRLLFSSISFLSSSSYPPRDSTGGQSLNFWISWAFFRIPLKTQACTSHIYVTKQSKQKLNRLLQI